MLMFIPIISQAVILSLFLVLQFSLESIKKKHEGGVDSQALFSHSGPATGFNMILLSIFGANLLPDKKINSSLFFLHAFNSLAFSFSATTSAAPLLRPVALFPIQKTGPGSHLYALQWKVSLSSVIRVPRPSTQADPSYLLPE